MPQARISNPESIRPNRVGKPAPGSGGHPRPCVDACYPSRIRRVCCGIDVIAQAPEEKAADGVLRIQLIVHIAHTALGSDLTLRVCEIGVDPKSRIGCRAVIISTVRNKPLSAACGVWVTRCRRAVRIQTR